MVAKPPPDPARVDAATGITVIVTASLAALYGLMVLITGAFIFVNRVVADTVTIPQPVSVDIPVASTGETHLTEGTFRMADITVVGIPDGVRALLASSSALDTIAHLAVVFGVIMLCISLLRGRPFMPAMVRTLTVTSFALVISGMLSTGLLAFANMEIAHLLDLPGFPMMGNLDFTAAFVGLALALVAAVFTIGQRMQRETEGLI
jgi:hypothetical protein